jgi:hypothetical protein
VSDSAETKQERRKRWKDCLEAGIDRAEDPIIITTFRSGWDSAARPVRARGIDKREYVIKGQQAGRQIVNDQVVARLGMAIGSPVGEPCIVEISEELIAEDSKFSYLTPGTAHATVYIPKCSSQREEINYTNQPENRERFALLILLYGWVYANDYQFIYKNARPNLVYSVDHGHFFPGGPEWNQRDLLEAANAEIHPRLVSKCQLKPEEISQGLMLLDAVSEESIIQAVAAPPREWGFTIDERVTMVEYLVKRRQDLLALL